MFSKCILPAKRVLSQNKSIFISSVSIPLYSFLIQPSLSSTTRHFTCTNFFSKTYFSTTTNNNSVLSSIANLSPTEIASLSLDDRISFARLGSLPMDKRTMIPINFFIYLTRSFYKEEQQLQELSIDELADLYIGLRKGLILPPPSSPTNVPTNPSLSYDVQNTTIPEDKLIQSVLKLLETLIIQHKHFLTLSDTVLQDIYTLLLTNIKSPVLQVFSNELSKRNISLNNTIVTTINKQQQQQNKQKSSSSSQDSSNKQQSQNKRKSRAGGFTPVTGTVLAVGTIATIASLWNRLYSSTLSSNGGKPPGKVVELLETATPESVIALVRFILASTDVSDLAPQQAQTLVAAATTAMLRSGLSKYTNEQLVALATLLPFNSLNTNNNNGVSDETNNNNNNNNASALIPRKFWDMLRNEISSRDPLSFQIDERITLAYVLTRLLRNSSNNTPTNTPNDISYRLLLSLLPSDIEKLLSTNSTLIQQYAFTSSYMKYFSLPHLQAFSKAINQYHIPIDNQDNKGGIINSQEMGPILLSVPILWDILQLYSHSIHNNDKEIFSTVQSIIQVLEQQSQTSNLFVLEEVNTRTLINMLVSRATWKTSSFTNNTNSSLSLLKVLNKSTVKNVISNNKVNSSQPFTNVWMLLSTNYAEYLMTELTRRITTPSNNKRHPSSIVSNPLEQLDTRRLLLTLWMSCQQLDIQGTIPIITKVSNIINQRQLNLDEHPFQLIQVCECIPPLINNQKISNSDQTNKKSIPNHNKDSITVSQVQLLQSIERGMQSTLNNNGLARYDLGACIRLFGDILDIDNYLYNQQQFQVTNKGNPKSMNAFTVAYSNEDILRFRNTIVKLSASIATEITGRLQGKIIRNNKSTNNYLTRNQRQKLLTNLQNIKNLAIYDGIQQNKNIEILNIFTSLQALLNVNGALMSNSNNNDSSNKLYENTEDEKEL